MFSPYAMTFDLNRWTVRIEIIIHIKFMSENRHLSGKTLAVNTLTDL